ncbi:hypothetical protein [Pelagibacterium lentulum]|uniref:Uncharacterized protein n=1 Tax=Pelagibacterium lentulum TaxID=2029865 RepID=A0A916W4H0_9HYPH|nr:hypothetical protein [Pelagibacterium lentulum]GGA64847.1 hypothetical protein GCM10011499_39120 [Pelagibacterium lentulum]
MQFVILPSDRDWLTVCAAMQAKGMPVEVQGSEVVIVAWHRGWTVGGVTTMEFAEPGDPIDQSWIRPDERDPVARERQREADHGQEIANITSMIDR